MTPLLALRPMSRRKRYTRNLGRRLPEPLPVRTTAEWVRFEHRDEPWGVFCFLDEAKVVGRTLDLLGL